MVYYFCIPPLYLIGPSTLLKIRFHIRLLIVETILRVTNARLPAFVIDGMIKRGNLTCFVFLNRGTDITNERHGQLSCIFLMYARIKQVLSMRCHHERQNTIFLSFFTFLFNYNCYTFKEFKTQMQKYNFFLSISRYLLRFILF